jgi:2-polyprenyl-3-methyl-5-hydroxy-6-metoxy-1,4-benzoquinol methylase
MERSQGGAGYVTLRTTPYRGHWLLRQAVARSVRPGGRVLEGGVSSGYFAAVMVEDGYTVDGVEIDEAAAKEAAAVCADLVVADLATVDPDRLHPPYDGMVFGDTLEHLADPPAALRRLRPLLADGGVVVASIPNVANWAMRLGLLAGRFRYTERGLLDRTHLRFYTARTVREMFAEAGFRVDELTASVPVPLVTWRPLLALAHRLGNLRPSLFAYTFVIVARPVDGSAPAARRGTANLAGLIGDDRAEAR